MDKMWAGRFSEKLNELADDFNSSLHFDCRMYKQDIKGSMAHAEMLASKGIITLEDSKLIVEGLGGILEDIETGKLTFNADAEDIHMFIESELTRRIGDAGKRLHTARSRNDQVALDIRMYLRDENNEILSLIRKLIETLRDKASENTDAIMPGYTHLQRAQPVTFAHHILAYAMMFKRDYERIVDAVLRMNSCPIGSCALAGTTYDTDRYMEAKLLNFDSVMLNSMDGVSDRDFCLELLSAYSILMMHLSRFSEEIVLWSSWEFKFIELSDSFSTGSSIMPQKKNPDMAELIRGKCGRVYGDLVALLTTLKGLPLAYNKDMQEDKEAIFDAVDNIKLCLSTFTPMLATMTVLKDNMRKAAAKGFINATDCADYLVKKGMPFRTAYKITGGLVALCISKNTTLEELPLDDYKNQSELFSEDIYEAISLDTCVNERKSYGGPSPDSVKKQIELTEKRLAELW